MTDLPIDAFPCPNCGQWLLPPVCCCARVHTLHAACANCEETFLIAFGRNRRTERLPDPRESWKWTHAATELMEGPA